MKIFTKVNLGAWSVSISVHAVAVVLISLLYRLPVSGELSKMREIEIGLVRPAPTEIEKKSPLPDENFPASIETTAKVPPLQKNLEEQSLLRPVRKKALELGAPGLKNTASLLRSARKKAQLKKKPGRRFIKKKREHQKRKPRRHSEKNSSFSCMRKIAMQTKVSKSVDIDAKASKKPGRKKEQKTNTLPDIHIPRKSIIHPPVALHTPNPKYPRRAMRMKKSGRVVLKLEVLATGKVGQMRLLRSSGHSVLDNAALKSVRRWRFRPARKNGNPVCAWLDVPIVFRLAP